MRETPPLPKTNLSTEKIELIDKKQFKKTEAYQKYVVPTIKRQKASTKRHRSEWWKNNWIGVVTLIVSIFSLLSTILFGLLQISN